MALMSRLRVLLLAPYPKGEPAPGQTLKIVE